ncbi:hypothetical protein OROMI_027334 [Orobanche minor]
MQKEIHGGNHGEKSFIRIERSVHKQAKSETDKPGGMRIALFHQFETVEDI